MSPIIIFATNRGLTSVRGTDFKAPHGMPLDLLDRLLIIGTKPYTRDEILEILKIRAKAEKITVAPEALEYLADIGAQSSLRYAVQLLAPAGEVATSEGAKKVTRKHISKVKELFVDVGRSVKYLREFEEKMLK
jgi:TBP-interacting protein